MNILIITDKNLTAIDRLAQSIYKWNKHFNIKILPVHPKRPDLDTLVEAQKLLEWCDLLDIHYWKSGEVLKQTFPVEFEHKPKILCHFNPYDVDKQRWLDTYNAVVVGNESIRNTIPYAYLIPYCIDLDFWGYKQDIPDTKVINMCVGRIEGKKGVKEVAQACNELGYKFVLAGRVSDDNYMREVFNAGGKNFEFRENVTDPELREIYYNSSLHVCNSVDGFESGTLPMLDNMACGVPVLTRNIGHVPDIYNGKNMVVRDGKVEDIDDLKNNIKAIIGNPQWRENLRLGAWDTIKNRQEEKMARMFSMLYYKILYGERPLVSVIVPTYDRHENLVDCLAKISVQTYRYIEIIVVDSGNIPCDAITRKFLNEVKVPIKYIRFDNKGEYTLPKARNMGVIEAEGEVLVFCDDRIGMEKDAVKIFVENIKNGVWLWGEKDNTKKSFVENFSCCMRRDIIAHGMFNERIDCYGGATQDIRERFEKMGGMSLLPIEAKAVSIVKSKAKWKKKKDISRAKLILYKLYE
jgi:glycosyltransferase involved in cell wall biosynthesis